MKFSNPMNIFATYGPAEFEPSPYIYCLEGTKKGREKEETFTPSTRRMFCFLFRDY